MTTQATATPVVKNKPKRRRLLPFSFEDRMELAPELRIAATYEEYIEYVHDCDYRVQYHDGYIVSFIETDEKTNTIMSEAAPIHERLMMRLARILGNIFDYPIQGNRYALFGSNIKIYIPNKNQSYNPDIAIAKEPAVYIKHRPKKRLITSVVNPHIIVEILSKGTRGFDKQEKLPDYKSLESVQQIIYVESTETLISTYIRISENEWRNIDFKNIDDKLPIVDENAVLLKDIYDGFPEFQK